MLASKETVHQLIPQCDPMIMVDTLLEHNEHETRTGFHISCDNLFISNGRFTAEGLLENIAQSAALRTGWAARDRHRGNESFKPPVGVIGAVKNYRVYRLPSCDSDIQTIIKLQAEFLNASMISGQVLQGNDILAEGELKIFLQEE
jgi:predicted hotdog family 3-hydroxylacyl-ACP dehydratase